MRLQLLQETSCLAIYYDSSNNWLFLDWHGNLTLPDVQAACLAVARCYLPFPYPRVLNDNTQVTGVSWSVAAWLATEFLPHLSLAGAEHVAWVCSPALPGRNLVQTVVKWLPGPAITCCDDVEEAVAWLRQLPAVPPGHAAPRLPAAQTQLERVVHELGQKINAPVPVTSSRNPSPVEGTPPATAPVAEVVR
jgi:hypothetical protein